MDTRSSEHTDPRYLPPETPKSRQEIQNPRTEPPINRARAKVLSQEHA